jgi:CDP-diacylglycerol--inositol 3-phosphatidyltransferase
MSHAVFLYLPNIIGYIRVLLSIYSFYIYNTASKFGAVLDMVTDRFSTAALVLILSHFYPKYILGFQILNILDFVSHWTRMYSGNFNLKYRII